MGALVALLALAAACGDDDDDDDDDGPTDTPAGTTAAPSDDALKIGSLLALTGDLADYGPPIETGMELAAKEINANGGVLGQDIEIVQGDSGTSPDQAAQEAQRLVDVEGVHAIVGALSSGVTLRVAEQVTGPSGVLQISPASTSPALTDANDSDFLFRTTISDAAQGLVLAALAEDAGITSVCNMYVNNAYGEGLSDSFTAAFGDVGGTITGAVPHEQEQPSYATELGECGDATTLAALAYPESAGIFLREAVEDSLFENYLFVDGTKSTSMLDQLGWASFDGVRGTAPAALPTDANTGFEERYTAEYGSLSTQPFIKEGYDAVYLIALAAEAAGSLDRTAIRDSLRDVSNAPGTEIAPGPEGWAAALTALAAGDDIDYNGVAGPHEFDASGDTLVGAVEWFHVDGAGEAFVQDKVFRADLAAGTVEEITE